MLEGMLASVATTKHVAHRLCLGNRLRFTTSAVRLRRHIIAEGRATNPDDDTQIPQKSPYYFEAGYSIFAKRASRPFPPPFLSKPSGSFSEPLTTHNAVRDQRPSVDGLFIKGITNGDDAIVIDGQNFLGVNDGVGAWAQKDRGHAALWSRLIAHFWATEIEKSYKGKEEIMVDDLNPTECLQKAYDQTTLTLTSPNEILGTSTASGALLHHRSENQPVILATTLGDCAVFVVRPRDREIVYQTKEQWHWFDCPRQLGTNSPDTPDKNAVTDVVDIEEDDVVVAMSDGVTDNLWDHEISQNVSESIQKWKSGDKEAEDGVVYVARQLMVAARNIAQDPYAESPYMERALDEGIAAEGGKLDDISVVIGVCRKRKQ